MRAILKGLAHADLAKKHTKNTQKTLLFFGKNLLLFYARLLCSINFYSGPFEMRQFKNNCSGLKIDWGSPPPAAAIYEMRITSLHFVVLHTFL